MRTRSGLRALLPGVAAVPRAATPLAPGPMPAPARAATAGLEEVHLARLSRRETEALAGELAGGGLGVQAIEDLYANTEGNPLFIVETVRAGWLRGGWGLGIGQDHGGS